MLASELGFHTTHFNAVQSACFHALMRTDQNVVVSAPTGSGKTVLFELAMVRCFTRERNAQVLYFGPTRSLCNERVKDWSGKLSGENLKVVEMTGDTDVQCSSMQANLIVATPEKFDSVTRQASEKCIDGIQLVMIDEVHMLNEQRGSTLEVVISRLKLRVPHARYVAVSATIPNSYDICQWLSTSNHQPALDLRFGDEMRPIPLQKHIICTPINGKNPFVYENSLTCQLPRLIEEYSDGKSTIVFCSTRKSAQMTAEFLRNNGKISAQKANAKRAKSHNLNNNKSSELMSAGVAVHHAGLSSHDRSVVETSFINGDIRVLCCTSTLAVGVNLPARLVIIKSTLMYNGRGYCEYSELDVLQMIGRAGRPQFDDRGVALILTDPINRDKYENLCRGMRPIESTLRNNLIEHINAEVAMSVLRTREDVVKWLKSTYLYVRMQAEPAKYNCKGKQVEDQLRSDVDEAIEKLKSVGLIRERPDCLLIPTKTGMGMAKAYVKFATIKAISEMTPHPSHRDILVAISQSGEFDELRFHPGDKSILNDMIKDPRIRYKDDDKLKHVWQRTFYLIQAILASIVIPKYGQQQAQEVQWIFTRSHKIIRCIIESLLDKNDGIGMLSALEVQGMLSAQLWYDSAPNVESSAEVRQGLYQDS